jgi:uncharacterized membrane protein
MKIKTLLILSFVFLLLPRTPLFAQSEPTEEVFKAQVIEIIETNESTREDGSISVQQKLKLKGLEGIFKNKEIIFDGTEFDVTSTSRYETGDKVMVNHSSVPEGKDVFYIVGFARSSPLCWLVLLFSLIVVLVGRLKGFRALIVLFLTFLIILKFIIPRILAGGDPLFASIIGSFFILILAIYLTEGLKISSTVAIFSIFISLIITGLLSVWFAAAAKLTGFASEESLYLIGISGGHINLKGLLLAGIVIGALGVLDDVVISQVMLVKELRNANPEATKRQIYRQAMKVGVSHLSSMVNTLFLAYAGASLPLLILFSVKEPPFLTFSQILNHEAIAAEIVRTVTGSIGLVLAVPIATLMAAQFIKKDKK